MTDSIEIGEITVLFESQRDSANPGRVLCYEIEGYEIGGKPATKEDLDKEFIVPSETTVQNILDDDYEESFKP